MNTKAQSNEGTAHKVPSNRFGVFALHCTGEPPSGAVVLGLIEGPLAAMQEDLEKHLEQP